MTHVYTYDALGRQVSDAVTSFGPGSGPNHEMQVDASVQRIDSSYDQSGRLADMDFIARTITAR